VIFDVVYHPSPREDPETTNQEIKATRKEVEQKISNLDTEKKIREDQAQVLEDYSKTLSADKSDTQALVGFLDLYSERKSAIHNDIQDISSKTEALRKELKEIRKLLWQDDVASKRKVGVTVVTLAEKSGKARLALSYGK
jgi:DNA repair exonuclease SbcCD ATPase subunit